MSKRASASIIVAAVVVTLANGQRAAEAAHCRGPLRRSCLNALFHCFNPKGTCHMQIAGGTVTLCWANRALEDSMIDAAQDRRTDALYSSHGALCAIGTAQLTMGTVTQWRRAFGKQTGKTWMVTVEADGSIAVTCPKGRVEHHTLAEIAKAGAQCGVSTTACPMGTCP